MAASNFGSSNLRNTKNSSGGRLVVVLCAISLVIFTLSCRESGSGVLSSIRGVFTIATTPVRQLGSVVSAPINGLGNVYANLTASQDTLTDLENENRDLKSKNAQLEESSQSVERLQSLLDLQSTYNLQSTGARIISGSTDSWSSTVTIDKGSSSGLTVGMPVCDSTGVIGQISECGTSSSVVRLVSDENSRVSAMVQSSRAQGTLSGSADGTLRLTGITTDRTVTVGDVIVTSGLGGVYPKGLPLGTVTSADKGSGALYYDIVIEPLSVTESQEEVLVITSLTDEQKAEATSDMSTSG